MSGCPFCGRIARNEFDSAGRDARVVWFEPLNPVTPGHMLFVPVRHVTSAADPQHGAFEASNAVDMAAWYAQRNGIESFNLITSAGAPATQTVQHLHVHLLPRRDGDGLALPWTGQKERQSIREQIPPERLEQLADWFDTDDEFKTTMFPETWPTRGNEVQQDLRRWAKILRSAA